MMELISFAKEECTLPLFQIPMAMLLVRHTMLHPQWGKMGHIYGIMG